MRRLTATAIAALALVVPAAAQADDQSLLNAYQSQAPALIAQDKAITKYTHRWIRHKPGAAKKAIKALKAQRLTLLQVYAAVQGQTESSPNGATAKQLCLQALQANSKSDASAISAFTAARHHHPAKAAHHFKVATKLLKQARKLDGQAGDAFRAAGLS